jgi:hypothetical protein
MAVLNIRTWPRGNIPGLRLTDVDVNLLRRVDCDIVAQGFSRIDRILIPPKNIFFSGSPTAKNSSAKCAWARAISGCVTYQNVFLGVHK